MSAGAPADRRSFLGSSLALASAVATSAATPTRAGILADHPDAELVGMGLALATAVGRQHHLRREADDAFGRYVPPAIPDALFVRPEDRHYVTPYPEKHLTESRG